MPSQHEVSTEYRVSTSRLPLPPLDVADINKRKRRLDNYNLKKTHIYIREREKYGDGPEKQKETQGHLE